MNRAGKVRRSGLRWSRGKDLRGSVYDRRDRKRWLLETFGDGQAVPCYWGCGTLLEFDTIEVDRYPICGHAGGRYVHGNIVASCPSCNAVRCSECAARRGHEAAVAELEDALERIDWRTAELDDEGHLLAFRTRDGERVQWREPAA